MNYFFKINQVGVAPLRKKEVVEDDIARIAVAKT